MRQTATRFVIGVSLLLQTPFQTAREQDALHSALANLPGTAVTAAAVVIVLLTAGAGGLIGNQAPGAAGSRMRQPASLLTSGLPHLHIAISAMLCTVMCAASWRTLGRIGGGLIGAAAGAFAAKRLQETRAKAASIVLHNLLASKADPRSLTRQEVQCTRCMRLSDRCIPLSAVLLSKLQITGYVYANPGRGHQYTLWCGYCKVADSRCGSYIRPVP
jgi:hypothetical protein